MPGITRDSARTPFRIRTAPGGPVPGALALLAALALAASPRTAAAQDARLAQRLDDGTRQAVAAIVDSARMRRLPVEPLVDKALEGASKRARPAQIVGAVRALASSLAAARTALGPEASDADVVAGASALRQGVSPELLRRLREQRARQGMTVALGVLTELAARGAPADTVARALMALGDVGATDATLAEFRRDVEEDIARGIASPTVAVQHRTEILIGVTQDGRSGGTGPGRRKP